MKRTLIAIVALGLLSAPLQAQKASTNSPLVNLATFSSDGSKLGLVQCVLGEGRSVSAIILKTGGFLGIGGKYVVIPDGKFTKAGERVQLSMTADEVWRLPERNERCN